MLLNTETDDRKKLITALAAEGLKAQEFESKDGTLHVVVPLLDADARPPVIAAKDPELRGYLKKAIQAELRHARVFIATHHLNSPLDIGLLVYSGEASLELNGQEWESAHSLGVAVEVFKRLWNARDDWLNAFTTGLGYSNE